MRPRLLLWLWLAIAGIAFAFAPPPPPSPVITAEEIRGLEASIERALEAADRWEETRGDRVIPWDEAQGHLAIVIDDVGRELHLFEQLHGLRYRLAFAILPGAVYSAGVQLRLRADRRRPREILLHLPMEPLNRGAMDPEVAAGEVFLEVDDPAEVLRAKAADALARVPAAIGVNNHMGSALTAERPAMDAFVGLLRERGLFALDSLTGPDSALTEAAADAGVPVLRRAFFLDHDPRRSAIEEQLALAAVAAREGPVVAIGHPSSALVEVLRERLPKLEAEGIAIVPLGEILRRTGGIGGAER
ncbi:MAG: divergent polysaccharide deacetylase family protein [Myxococcales bacterium]|nr:divergent polysaccharide deacetylase family protein [Myxococcales bacterium]